MGSYKITGGKGFVPSAPRIIPNSSARPQAIRRVDNGCVVIEGNRVSKEMLMAYRYERAPIVWVYRYPTPSLLLTLLRSLQAQNSPMLIHREGCTYAGDWTAEDFQDFESCLDILADGNPETPVLKKLLLPSLASTMSEFLRDFENRVASFGAIKARPKENRNLRFRVGEFVISANRGMLAEKAGPVLQLLLSRFSESGKDEIAIQEVHPVAFYELLRFIETGSADCDRLNETQLFELVRLADFYDERQLAYQLDLYLVMYFKRGCRENPDAVLDVPGISACPLTVARCHLEKLLRVLHEPEKKAKILSRNQSNSLSLLLRGAAAVLASARASEQARMEAPPVNALRV